MSLPQDNARLTEVRGPAGQDDYDQSGSEGPLKWSGSAPAYYRTKRERITTGEGSDVIVRRELIVHTRRPAIEWAAGDVLAFSVEGGVQTGEVQEYEVRRLPAAGIVETTLITLENG